MPGYSWGIRQLHAGEWRWHRRSCHLLQKSGPRRLWRQGQQSETVVIQHLITKGTIDERILKALTQKEQTQTALMQAVKAELGGRP